MLVFIYSVLLHMIIDFFFIDYCNSITFDAYIMLYMFYLANFKL